MSEPFKIQDQHEDCFSYQLNLSSNSLRASYDYEMHTRNISELMEGEVLLLDEPDLLIILAGRDDLAIYTIKEVSSDHLS